VNYAKNTYEEVMAKLISASILFRHGARGPGDSESSAWEKSDEVVTQWQTDEFENLSPVGRQMITLLGAYCARRYSPERFRSNRNRLVTSFRSSKADRARESGEDFVTGFNNFAGHVAISETAEPFEHNVDADYFFRPWKVYKYIWADKKERMKMPYWLERTEQNREILLKMCTELGLKEEYKTNLSKALYSATHVVGLSDCELYWCQTNGDCRDALTRRLDVAFLDEITTLAIWVWEERFIRSGTEVQLGGWIFLEMIQKCFNGVTDFNCFAGHDYTILGMLTAMGELKTLTAPMRFGSYLIFELWDGPMESDSGKGNSGKPNGNASTVPATNGSLSTAETLSTEKSFRIILNSKAFLPRNSFLSEGRQPPSSSSAGEPGADDSLSGPVHPENEVVLAVYSMTEIKEIVEKVCRSLTDCGVGLPPSFLMPQFD
jgi:hypothetical protein